MRNQQFFENALTLWQGVVQNEPITELQWQMDVYQQLFNFFQVGQSYFYIFNFAIMEVEYVSPEIKTVLGFDRRLQVSEFMARIHPDDSSYYLNFENEAVRFLRDLPYDKLGKYKVQYDFRVRNASGEYIRLLQQAILIHFDEQKNFYRSMAVHSDISHIKKAGNPCLSFIGIEGEPSYINMDAPAVFKTASHGFTRREMEILRYIVLGKTSEEIATELYISLHTVKTHRKNILQKASVKTPLDLTRKALSEGWI